MRVEQYDLIRKISCWDILAIEQDELKLEYRGGLAKITVAPNGRITSDKSKFSVKASNSENAISDYWKCVDGSMC